MNKKSIGIFVCMLLIYTVLSVSGNVILESTLTPVSFSNTLYVGGSGPGNYSNIQDAIDNASDGDTVFVFDDSSPYFERVKINKSIDLIGEDRNTTVIDANGGGVVIFIASDNVSIHEFTLQNSSRGVDIDVYFGFCTISDNNIIDNNYGISTFKSGNNIIEDNTFFDNIYWTISVDGNNNMISGNTIDHSPGTYHGIGVAIDRGTGSNISGNTIKNGDRGISLHESDNNIVLNNIISSGYREGIYIADSSNNTIIGNNISYHLYWGIEVRKGWEGDSNDNVIYHNNLVYNKYNAIDEGDNIWDDGKYGNYWSDYQERYPDAKKKRREGIWDTPYEIAGGDNKDRCPLIKQWPNFKPRTITRNTALYSSYLLRFLEQFPMLQKILNIIL